MGSDCEPMALATGLWDSLLLVQFEIRNQGEGPKSQGPKPQNHAFSQGIRKGGFRSFEFEIWNVFRVSGFEFRASSFSPRDVPLLGYFSFFCPVWLMGSYLFNNKATKKPANLSPVRGRAGNSTGPTSRLGNVMPGYAALT